MGTLLYGSRSVSAEFTDRALYHLQVVITAKLRRKESFTFSWQDGPQAGSGRSAIWLDPSSTIHYRFFGSKLPSLNRVWLDALMLSANSASGLVYTAEPATIEPVD